MAEWKTYEAVVRIRVKAKPGYRERDFRWDVFRAINTGQLMRLVKDDPFVDSTGKLDVLQASRVAAAAKRTA